MLFSELYSAYYNAVAEIIRTAIDHPLQKDEVRRIVTSRAFGESMMTIEPALSDGRWQLLRADGTTIIKKRPEMPLTEIQKRWIKSISMDPRVRLFTDEMPDYPDVKPLFTPEDYSVFDKYLDGDDFEDENYRTRFRLIMDAVRNSYPLQIEVADRKGRTKKKTIRPKYLEYSEKDDKFRVISSDEHAGGVYNLGRIISCERYKGDFNERKKRQSGPEICKVVFELEDRRNALERVLFHFAHFEKEAEKIGKDKYRVSLNYEKDDETEILIRILSFGPMIKVLEPDGFVELIKERLHKQKSCGL